MMDTEVAIQLKMTAMTATTKLAVVVEDISTNPLYKHLVDKSATVSELGIFPQDGDVTDDGAAKLTAGTLHTDSPNSISTTVETVIEDMETAILNGQTYPVNNDFTDTDF